MVVATEEELTPLQPKYSFSSEKEDIVPNRAQFYQSVVDDARR